MDKHSEAAQPLNLVPPPTLSLCIPTYNRAALLAQALRAVLEQISPEEAAQMEMLVLDNASPDDTPGVVEQAVRQWPHAPLRYVRHPENLGMDGNFLAAISQAQGKFVCLLSDDDILLPGGVAKLLGLIQQYPDFGGFCLNVRSFAHDPLEESPLRLALLEDRVLAEQNETLELIRSSITFLSILMFNKSCISDRLAAGYYNDKIGTYSLLGYPFLDVIAAGKGIVAVAQPIVAQRVENTDALNYFQVFITELTALLNYAEAAGYSRKLIRRIKTENLVDARYFVALVKIYNRQTELWSSRGDAIRRLFAVYRFRPYLWLVVVPLMFFPRSLRPLVHLARRLLGRAPIAEKKEERKEAAQAHTASSGKAP